MYAPAERDPSCCASVVATLDWDVALGVAACAAGATAIARTPAAATASPVRRDLGVNLNVPPRGAGTPRMACPGVAWAMALGSRRTQVDQYRPLGLPEAAGAGGENRLPG